jgi:hypothetical protein
MALLSETIANSRALLVAKREDCQRRIEAAQAEAAAQLAAQASADADIANIDQILATYADAIALLDQGGTP